MGAGALYWYRKAADAGVEQAKSAVERLERLSEQETHPQVAGAN